MTKEDIVDITCNTCGEYTSVNANTTCYRDTGVFEVPDGMAFDEFLDADLTCLSCGGRSTEQVFIEGGHE